VAHHPERLELDKRVTGAHRIILFQRTEVFQLLALCHCRCHWVKYWPAWLFSR